MLLDYLPINKVMLYFYTIAIILKNDTIEWEWHYYDHNILFFTLHI